MWNILLHNNVYIVIQLKIIKLKAFLKIIISLFMVSCCHVMAYPLTDDTDSAQYYFYKKNYPQARKMAEQNIQAASAVDAWDIVLQNYETLIVIDSITRNFSAAFKHLKEKEKVAQKLFDLQKSKIIYDSAKLQPIEELYLQIAKMEKVLQKAEESVPFRFKMVVAMIVVACFLLIVTLVQIYRHEMNKRLNHKLIDDIHQGDHQLKELTLLIQKTDEENQLLTQENTRLEATNAVKDKLLSVISHDLRSPISSLQALLNLFNANNIARAELVDFFGKLLSRVENTSTMLENLLHWSQYQLRGLEPIFDRLNLQIIIDECINLYHMQAEQKHIVIDNSLKTNVHVLADVEMLKVILRNLISNALKFTHSGGIITIMTMIKENHAVISVKDTGVGISPENQKKMFAMGNFTTPGTEKEKGTGLGLMLCKDFVEHNRGKLWMDSKLNVGTTFHFTIPTAEE